MFNKQFLVPARRLLFGVRTRLPGIDSPVGRAKTARGMLMRKLLMIAAAVVGIAAAPASANYIFAGIGSSGTLASATETWALGCFGDACPAGTTGWGSPGVSLATTTYGEAQTAIDFEITFIGATIDPGSLAIGSAGGCTGTEIGGTVFCNASLGTTWTATLDDPSTIHFVDTSGVGLLTGQSYFVNIFLVGEGIERVAFTGAWSTPEPTTLALLGIALAGIGFSRRRRAA